MLLSCGVIFPYPQHSIARAPALPALEAVRKRSLAAWQHSPLNAHWSFWEHGWKKAWTSWVDISCESSLTFGLMGFRQRWSTHGFWPKSSARGQGPPARAKMNMKILRRCIQGRFWHWTLLTLEECIPTAFQLSQYPLTILFFLMRQELSDKLWKLCPCWSRQSLR